MTTSSVSSRSCSISRHVPSILITRCSRAGKATDENSTSEDWGAIIEVCDKVTGDASGPKEAAQSMIKRLAHRNANVQLYTLEVWDPMGGGSRGLKTKMI